MKESGEETGCRGGQKLKKTSHLELSSDASAPPTCCSNLTCKGSDRGGLRRSPVSYRSTALNCESHKVTLESKNKTWSWM